MSMKDDILALLSKGEPMADSELAELLGAPQPSVRRARQQLVTAGKAKQQGEIDGNKMWVAGEAKEPAEKPAVGAPTSDKPEGWSPGSETNKEARRAEIAERAKQLQGGPRLF